MPLLTLNCGEFPAKARLPVAFAAVYANIEDVRLGISCHSLRFVLGLIVMCLLPALVSCQGRRRSVTTTTDSLREHHFIESNRIAQDSTLRSSASVVKSSSHTSDTVSEREFVTLVVGAAGDTLRQERVVWRDRIRLQHLRDTVTRTDTLFRSRTDTVFINRTDTVYIYKGREKETTSDDGQYRAAVKEATFRLYVWRVAAAALLIWWLRRKLRVKS